MSILAQAIIQDLARGPGVTKKWEKMTHCTVKDVSLCISNRLTKIQHA